MLHQPAHLHDFYDGGRKCRQCGWRVDRLAIAVAIAMVVVSAFRLLRPFELVSASTFDRIVEVNAGAWCLPLALLAIYGIHESRHRLVIPFSLALILCTVLLVVNIGLLAWHAKQLDDLYLLSKQTRYYYWNDPFITSRRDNDEAQELLLEERRRAIGVCILYAILVPLQTWFTGVIYRAHMFLREKCMAAQGLAVRYLHRGPAALNGSAMVVSPAPASSSIEPGSSIAGPSKLVCCSSGHASNHVAYANPGEPPAYLQALSMMSPGSGIVNRPSGNNKM